MSIAPTLLSVEGLSKSYGGVHAVRGVSFALHAGEILALIGPNGAGKSTCFDMLNGQNVPDSGRINLLGQDTAGMKPRAIWRLGVGRTFQITATFPTMTVRENVQVALVSYRRQLFNLWSSTPRFARAEAGALLELVGMSGYAERPCGELAYGDLKRLELAIALANQPKLLLMDEPTAGMAPRERIELMRLTASIAREQSIGVLFTEHDMDVVFEHADRILVLNRGTLIAEGSPEKSGATRRSAPSISARAWSMTPAIVTERRHEAQRSRSQQSLRPRPYPVRHCARGRRRRGGGAAGTQRRRQIHHLSLHHRPGRATHRPHRVRGPDISDQPTHAIVRGGLGYVPEERRIFTDLFVSAAGTFLYGPADYLGTEHRTPVFLLMGIVLARDLAVRHRSWFADPAASRTAVGALLVGALLFVGLPIDQLQHPEGFDDPAQFPQLVLADWLEQHGLQRGYGPYDDASIITVETHGRVAVRPLISTGRYGAPPRSTWRLIPNIELMANGAWYTSQAPGTFLIVDGQDVDAQTAVATFGPPDQTYQVAQWQVLTWKTGIVCTLPDPTPQVRAEEAGGTPPEGASCRRASGPAATRHDVRTQAAPRTGRGRPHL